MGWDAFGLPTENYAIKMGLQPAVVTKKNTDNFRKQMKSLGLSFDWSREVNTTDPKYYQWTQWIFLHLFKQGLAEKQALKINWCPKDKIGLANEEVIDGKCERCGTAVEKKDKVQWVIKITKYADRLIDDLKNVDYPQRVKDQQINWIGRSEGALLKFQIINPKSQIISNNQNSKLQDEFVEVFTTRPDTIFGATFLVVAPEHSLLEDCKSQITNDKEVEDYIRQAKNKSDLERQEQKEKNRR
jgi:leucyl-tRNA synthetase